MSPSSESRFFLLDQKTGLSLLSSLSLSGDGAGAEKRNFRIGGVSVCTDTSCCCSISTVSSWPSSVSVVRLRLDVASCSSNASILRSLSPIIRIKRPNSKCLSASFMLESARERITSSASRRSTVSFSQYTPKALHAIACEAPSSSRTRRAKLRPATAEADTSSSIALLSPIITVTSASSPRVVTSEV
jgi:hypothetical protein